jgi:hypothetical protein
MAARAQAETWMCTYADVNGTPQITKLEIQNDSVIQSNTTACRLVANNDLLLVATNPMILQDPVTKQILLGANTIMIAKKTGTFAEFGGIISANNFTPYRGSCVKN